MKNHDYRLHTQRKNNQSLSSDFASTPELGRFESRPFVVQQKLQENSQQPDLKASLTRAERYGHHLARIKPAGISTTNELTHVVQEKGGVVQRSPSSIEDNLNYALIAENNTRSEIPAAANQKDDLLKDPLALARHEETRFMNRALRRGIAQPYGAADLDNSPINTLATAMSAYRFGGGMCNEYSAATFAHHMATPKIASSMPIVRHWNENMGHSFTSVGDTRDPHQEPFVADPWTQKRDPQLFKNTVMAGGQNKTIATWSDRMPGEGKNLVGKSYHEIKTIYDRASRNPQLERELDQIREEKTQQQSNMAPHLATQPNWHDNYPWVYEHDTNRKPALR